MSKRLKLVLLVSAIIICLGGIFRHISFNNDNRSISITGGEDGPTTVILAGRLGGENSQIDMEEIESSSDSDGMEVATENTESKEMSEEEILYTINEKYYASWTENDMAKAISERSPYYQKSAYYKEVSNYVENVLEISDIKNVVEPIYFTDMKFYSTDNFKDIPPLIIHIAKNEIYARHGYIFKNEDLYNYFMGCIWYNPTCSIDEFDDSVLNQYEQANLKLLTELDDYK